MKLARVILRVRHLDSSVAFWSEMVGLPLISAEGNFAFIGQGGDAQLVLNEIDIEVVDESLTELVLEVDDVEGSFRAMSARGVKFEVGLRPVTSDGDRVLLASHFRDPDGHLASLTGWS